MQKKKVTRKLPFHALKVVFRKRCFSYRKTCVHQQPHSGQRVWYQTARGRVGLTHCTCCHVQICGLSWPASSTWTKIFLNLIFRSLEVAKLFCVQLVQNSNTSSPVMQFVHMLDLQVNHWNLCDFTDPFKSHLRCSSTVKVTPEVAIFGWEGGASEDKWLRTWGYLRQHLMLIVMMETINSFNCLLST